MVETYLATGWEFCRAGATDWRQARVPGCVHDDLVRHGEIADPFYRMNERECQWVDDEDWTYRCRFDWSPKDGCPKRVLCFEGLDTVCRVLLNGEVVAVHDNMFLPLEVEVTSLLRSTNELVIEFSSAVRVANERRARYLAQEGIAPSLTTFYERSFLRKAQYMFGWDWGPRLVSCGVWKTVKLIEYDTRVTDVWARPRLLDGEWLVDVHWEGERLRMHECQWSNGVEVAETFEFGAQLRVKDPDLWWPSDFHDLGNNLYSGILRFGGIEHGLRFGLRTVELLQEPDQWGRSFEIVVNGERVFCKGANWIPDHSFPALVTGEQYESQVAKMQDLNFNMVRVWGGGLYESNAFYDACDRRGIMVWQDFPFACAYYPEDDAFAASVEAEARANIRRLRNHPSLVLWCGNNECQQMHEQKWGGQASPARCYGERLFDEVLPRVLSEEDPDRPYVHGSPSGKTEGRDCNMDGVGDSHYWDVWHGRGDWKFYEESKSRFSSEFGFASSPSLYTWSKCLDPEIDWAFDSEAVKWHDKTLKGYEKYISFIELHYPKVETLEDLVYFSQLNQRDALRCGIEHYLLADFCAGTLVWQFNDCWPVQSWSIQDSSYRLKPAAIEMRRLYGRKSLVLRLDERRIKGYVTQRTQGIEAPDEPVRLSVLNSMTGEEVASAPIGASNGKAVSQVLDLDVSALDPACHVVYAPQPGAWRSSYQARLLCEPKDARLVQCPIVLYLDEGGGCHLLATHPVVDLMIWDPGNPANGGEAMFEPFLYPDEPEPFLPRFDQEPKRLVARSLAGYHEVEITRSPL